MSLVGGSEVFSTAGRLTRFAFIEYEYDWTQFQLNTGGGFNKLKHICQLQQGL